MRFQPFEDKIPVINEKHVIITENKQQQDDYQKLLDVQVNDNTKRPNPRIKKKKQESSRGK